MRIMISIAILCGALVSTFLLNPKPPRAELTVGYVSIETLDPQIASASEDIRVTYALFEGLVTFNPYTFEVIPGVAESWDISEDRTVYTFHLRKDAKWSNGDPLIAQHFVDTWRMGLMPDIAPDYIMFIQVIKGGSAFTDWCTAENKKISEMSANTPRQITDKWKAAQRRAAESVAKFKELVGVKVLDDHTMEVQLERPVPYVLEWFASWPLFPLHPSVHKEHTALHPVSHMLRREPDWIEPGTMISNGPYRLAGEQFKNYIRFEANEHYWNRAIVGPKTVEMLAFSGTDAWYNAYEIGLVDVVYDAQNLGFAADLVQMKKKGRRKDVVVHAGFSTYYYCFNTRPTLPNGSPNPFTDSRVRRAFALALNRQSIVEDVTRVGQIPASTLVPVGSVPGYASPEGIGYDPEQAKKYLAEAGYPNGKGLPVIELSFNTGAGHEDKAQAAANMWKNTLGVTVKLVPQEWKVFLENRKKGDFMIARHAWTGDYADPTTFLDLFQTGNGNNDAGFSDPHYDSLLEKAAGLAHDPVRRMEVLHEAERYLIDEQAAMCPVYYYVNIHMQAPHWTGVNEHPRDLQFFHLMRRRPTEKSAESSPESSG